VSRPWPPGDEPGAPADGLGTVQPDGSELARWWPDGPPGQDWGTPPAAPPDELGAGAGLAAGTGTGRDPAAGSGTGAGRATAAAASPGAVPGEAAGAGLAAAQAVSQPPSAEET
jgi:hypothetical protein